MNFKSYIFLDNGLTGTIPNLENLVLLADFNLKGNSLSGTIPQKIGQLVQLQSLDFLIIKFLEAYQILLSLQII